MTKRGAAKGSAEKPSLAERIRKAKSQNPVQERLTTDESILARITDGIYRQPASALRELISNAYDADATEVTILTDAPRFKEISIRDNGIGLSPEVLEHLIWHIGGSAKRTHEGQALHIANDTDPERTPGGRKMIGKMGIGLFSVAQFTRHFLIITKTRGQRFRLIADITLGTGRDGRGSGASENAGEITTGDASIWTEPAADVETQGTEIKLLDLLPRTKAELSSQDLWSKIDFEQESDGYSTTPKPVFHIGRIKRGTKDEILEVPCLPWKKSEKARERFMSLVLMVRALAETDKELVDLDAVCDSYLRTLWTLSLAAPLDYLGPNPFDLREGGDIRFFQLENRTKGQAKPLEVRERQTLRGKLGLRSPFRPEGDRFTVTVDGVQLSRPILFLDQPKTQSAVKTPLLFVGQCREEFSGKPKLLSGGPLEFEAYLFWTPKVLPTQHQGVMIRVGDAAGTLFDRTFMGYQVSEINRLRQITAEIFVREGLDSAINLDRESFNFAHPHYQFLTKWLHSALRQLANKHKELGSQARQQRITTAGKKAQKQLDKLVAAKLRLRGIEDVPDVQLLDTADEVRGKVLRKEGVIALSRDKVIPPQTQKSTKTEAERRKLLDSKAVAIAQVLSSWGVLDRLSFKEQEQLIRELLEIMNATVEP